MASKDQAHGKSSSSFIEMKVRRRYSFSAQTPLEQKRTENTYKSTTASDIYNQLRLRIDREFESMPQRIERQVITTIQYTLANPETWLPEARYGARLSTIDQTINLLVQRSNYLSTKLIEVESRHDNKYSTSQPETTTSHQQSQAQPVSQASLDILGTHFAMGKEHRRQGQYGRETQGGGMQTSGILNQPSSLLPPIKHIKHQPVQTKHRCLTDTDPTTQKKPRLA